MTHPATVEWNVVVTIPEATSREACKVFRP